MRAVDDWRLWRLGARRHEVHHVLLIAHVPERHEAVQRWFMRAAPALVMTSPAIDSVQIAPYGHVAAIYPLVSARRNATGILLGGSCLKPGGGDLSRSR